VKKVYFEDLAEGSVHWGRECIVDKDEMLEYNRKNDPWPFHVDEEAATQSPFGGLIASGGYTITLLYRSTHTIYNRPEAPWAFLGGFEWHVRFHLPVRPGDRLRSKITILSKRPSSKPGRGVVKWKTEMLNQKDQVVFALEECTVLLAKRPERTK
jgi:acyl dehydratase